MNLRAKANPTTPKPSNPAVTPPSGRLTCVGIAAAEKLITSKEANASEMPDILFMPHIKHTVCQNRSVFVICYVTAIYRLT